MSRRNGLFPASRRLVLNPQDIRRDPCPDLGFVYVDVVGDLVHGVEDGLAEFVVEHLDSFLFDHRGML